VFAVGLSVSIMMGTKVGLGAPDSSEQFKPRTLLSRRDQVRVGNAAQAVHLRLTRSCTTPRSWRPKLRS
jgi:hypothetical protein